MNDIPGSSRKLEVRLCLPLAVALKFKGPISSFEVWETADATESREPRLEARYANPPPVEIYETESFIIKAGLVF